VEVPGQARQIMIVEWGGASQLSRRGVSQGTLKPGDRVIVTGNPSRNPKETKSRMVSIVRPSDGWRWDAESR
jgi:hypothetical protein